MDKPSQRMSLAEMYWGDYFGNLTDNFGVQWMFNCKSKTQIGWTTSR